MTLEHWKDLDWVGKQDEETRKRWLDYNNKRFGGFTRRFFEYCKIPYPPPRGWRKRILKGDVSKQAWSEANRRSQKRISSKKKKREKKKTRIAKKPQEDFLQSYEWRKVRYTALINNNGCCECCGRSAKEGIYLNVDHIKPRKDFPELALDPDNLQVLCNECNHGKANWDRTEWRQV